jgi:hypothetical protein
MHARPSCLLAVFAALLALGPAARGQSNAAPVGRLLPLAVHDGQCECTLPTAQPGDKFYLIVASLARDAGPHRVTVSTAAGTGPVSLPRDQARPDPVWEQRVREWRERLAWARQQHAADDAYPPTDPPHEKTFHVFARDGDFQSPDSYVTVTALLRSVGQHCQVYVDRDHDDVAGLQPTVDDVVATFDREVYPRAQRLLGRALDVDRDGRFTILLTPWLSRMAGGKVSLGGFVRGSDFFRDLAAPFGNRCDMMYLNTDLKPGPYLHTLLAHEYTHAVVFSEHVFTGYLPGQPRQDEEGWLNEGLAHLVEDVHGYSWANLDYRISAFLSAPERYQLVVPDYYAAGLFRSHGNRGATYLFLRWCSDRYGRDFITQLTQTNLRGVANLEATTGAPFAELFRQWTAALALSGTGLPLHDVPPLTRLDLHGPLGGRLLCGPRIEELSLAGGSHEVALAGTSAAYLLLHSPTGKQSQVTIRAEAGTDLQVSLIRLPRRTPRLAVRCEPGKTAGTYSLEATAYDGEVVLGSAVWERRTPRTNRPEDTSYAAERGGKSAIVWMGSPRLRPGESCRSAPFSVPEAAGPDGAWVIKVSARDLAGHAMGAWAAPSTTHP